MCLYKQNSEYTWDAKYAKTLNIVCKVLNMRASHSAQNMPEYDLTEL